MNDSELSELINRLNALDDDIQEWISTLDKLRNEAKRMNADYQIVRMEIFSWAG